MANGPVMTILTMTEQNNPIVNITEQDTSWVTQGLVNALEGQLSALHSNTER